MAEGQMIPIPLVPKTVIVREVQIQVGPNDPGQITGRPPKG